MRARRFNLDFRDDYLTNADRAMGQDGYMQISLSASGAVWVILMCVFGAIGTAIGYVFYRINLIAEKQVNKQVVDAVRELSHVTQKYKTAKSIKADDAPAAAAGVMEDDAADMVTTITEQP